MDREKIGIYLGTELNLVTQLRWAAKLVRARRAELFIYQPMEDSDSGISQVDLRNPPEGEGGRVPRKVLQALQSIPELAVAPDEPEGDIPNDSPDEGPWRVTLKRVRYTDFRALKNLLLTETKESKLKLLTRVLDSFQGSDPEMAKERQQFLQYVPCDVVYVAGLREDTDPARVLAGVDTGSHATAALKLGHDLAAVEHGHLTALHVNPLIGPDSESVGRRRLESRLKRAIGEPTADVRPRVVVDDQIPQGVRAVWEEGDHDLVVLGMPRMKSEGGRLAVGIGSRLMKADPRPAVAVVCAGSPLRNRFYGLAEGLIQRVVPQIYREDRIALVDRIQSSSYWDFDFVALMVLSTAIAAIGLLQNSGAVVIGAMLVAPLMTPILGLGLALVQGNPVLARISVRTILFGVVVALSVGALIGLMTPGFVEPTREMLGRGGPSLLDLFVAFASGLAAAYASSRPGLLAALPGVAIAAALVPPIATSGLALSLGNLDLAFNALLLFVINMVTIALATVVSLWAVGIRSIKKTQTWSLMMMNTVVVAVLIMGVYLSVRPDEHQATKGLPKDLEGAIEDVLGENHRLGGFALAYDELGVQLMVRVESEDHVTSDLADEVRAVARSHFDVPVRVRLVSEVDATGFP